MVARFSKIYFFIHGRVNREMDINYLETDATLMEILKERKTIAEFLDSVFGFLHRNTNFYHMEKNSSEKNELAGNIRWQLVYTALQRYELERKLQSMDEVSRYGDHAPPAVEEVEVETECLANSSITILTKEWQTSLMHTNLELIDAKCLPPNSVESPDQKSQSMAQQPLQKMPKDMQCKSPTLCKILPKSSSGTNCDFVYSSTEKKRPRRVYKCTDCAEAFTSFRQLREHESFHMPSNIDGINICQYCCSLYANTEILEKHESDCHANGKKYLCVPCQKSYSSKGQLLKHVRSKVHNACGLLYYCSLCPRSNSATEFPTRSALQQHFQEMHLLMPSNQEEDDVEIEMNEEFLDEFLLNNATENSFHFSECWDALDLHLPDMLHLQNSGNNITDDQPTTAAFKCPKCYEGCVSQKKLLRHMAHKHALRVLICNQCESSFNDYTQWMRHKATHRAANRDELTAETSNDAKKCGICDRSFHSKAALNYHIKSHSQGVLRPHECPYCGKCFHTDVNIKQHIRIVHIQTKKHICELCDKQFTTLDHLKKHVLSQHQNERKHVCNVCKKRFTQLCHLKQHTAIHTTGKMQKCSFCEATFWRKIDLERHTLNRHV